MQYRIVKTLGHKLRRGQIVDWSVTVVNRLSKKLGLEPHEWIIPVNLGESYIERAERLRRDMREVENVD